MSNYLAQVIVFASNSDGEDTFWVELLVLVILAASWGVYNLLKTGTNKFGDREGDYPAETFSRGSWLGRQKEALKKLKDKCVAIFLKKARAKVVAERAALDLDSSYVAGRGKPKAEPAGGKNLAGGMEMLEQDFLVRVVEKTEGADKKDVMMRKLGFNELVRRRQLRAADSNSLKIYAINKRNLYGKKIQCEAMRELAERTGVRLGG